MVEAFTKHAHKVLAQETQKHDRVIGVAPTDSNLLRQVKREGVHYAWRTPAVNPAPSAPSALSSCLATIGKAVTAADHFIARTVQSYSDFKREYPTLAEITEKTVQLLTTYTFVGRVGKVGLATIAGGVAATSGARLLGTDEQLVDVVGEGLSKAGLVASAPHLARFLVNEAMSRAGAKAGMKAAKGARKQKVHTEGGGGGGTEPRQEPLLRDYKPPKSGEASTNFNAKKVDPPYAGKQVGGKKVSGVSKGKSSYKDGENAGFDRFTKRIDANKFEDPKTRQILERDRARHSGSGPHGKSVWKIHDRHGKRLGTFNEKGIKIRD